jgi:oxygen-independent coproporphyrinogen-3 oxidase
VAISETGLTVPDKARPFVRNICMAFDLLLLKSDAQKNLFSQTI